MTCESRPAARECKWLLLFKIILKFSNSLCFSKIFKFPVFSLSGITFHNFPCFPCAVGTLLCLDDIRSLHWHMTQQRTKLDFCVSKFNVYFLFVLILSMCLITILSNVLKACTFTERAIGCSCRISHGLSWTLEAVILA